MPQLRYKIYSETGELSFQRPVMVMIHGLGGGYSNWYRQVHTLKRLYDLVLIELPSHGKSRVMLSEMEISFDALTDLIMEVVDYLGIKKATYVGISLGTMFVKYIVMHHPERVDRYILTGPICDYTLTMVAALMLVKMLLFFLPLKIVLKLGATIVMPHKVSKYGRDLFISCAKRIPRKECIAWCTILAKFKNIQKEYQAVAGEESNGLYIVGALDYFFIPLLQKDKDRVENMVFIENAGHLCISDQAKVVNDHIIHFQNTGKVKSK